MFAWHERLQKRVPVEERVLFCPACREQHVDEGEWATRPHRTHQCQKCMHEWTEAKHYTVGVKQKKETT